jgi:hypothetical protein
MKFKESHMQAQLKGAPLLLRFVAEDFDKLCKEMEIEPVITRVTDTVKGESGVHPDYRAFDVRDEYGGKFVFDKMQREYLVEKLNEKYKRNDGKVTVLWHSFGGGPHHFHVQIATLTKTYMDVKPKGA